MTDLHAPPLGCGQADHDDACLCDVVVEHPTPIRFGTHELWHGAAITRALDLGVPWSGASFEKFGDALLRAHDIFVQLGSGASHDVTTLAERAKELLRTGTSMVDVHRQLECTRSMVVQALTNNSPSDCWDWDEQRWLEVEGVVYDRFASFTIRQAAAVLGCGRRLAANLADWYGVRLGQGAQSRLDAMKAALVEGLHPIDAAAHVEALGYEVTLSQMRATRRRLVERGECAAELPARR